MTRSSAAWPERVDGQAAVPRLPPRNSKVSFTVMALTLGELADRIHATLSDPAQADVQVTGCQTLADADPSHISFLHHPRYLEQLRQTRVAAVIAALDTEANGQTLLIADDPYFAFRNAAIELHGWREQPQPGIDPNAYIDETATLADLCTVRPFAYIAPRARIGRRCIIYPGVYVGKNAIIGDDCILHPNVTVYDHCVLGNRVTLHAGCVIGQDGFGYATHAGEHHKIPTPGNAVIEDDVEMGAGCSVDRATVGSTIVGLGKSLSICGSAWIVSSCGPSQLPSHCTYAMIDSPFLFGVRPSSS